jgi:hypothetical protein
MVEHYTHASTESFLVAVEVIKRELSLYTREPENLPAI